MIRRAYSRQRAWVPVLFIAVVTSTQATGASLPPDLQRVASHRGITEYRLSNGLQVLLCPDNRTPTFTVVMTYRVGSRHEGLGERGMAHMLEHMLGKRTASYESTFGELSKRGADWNADTWFDRTKFYETLAAKPENLDFVLHLEAERMNRAALDSTELATEMSVITNEFQYIDSDPLRVLSDRMMSAAYDWHNYGFPTIGNLSDIKRYPVENLRLFYRRHYRPDNATLYVGGRFDTDQVLHQIHTHLGAVPRPPTALATTTTEEPAQEGPREVTVRRVGEVQAAAVMYHVPPALHPDSAPLQVLLEIVTASPSGRLYPVLVESGLAASVAPGKSEAERLAEPGVLEIAAVVPGTGSPRQSLTAMISNLEESQEFTERQVDLAKARILRERRGTAADVRELGIELSEWIAAGDWRGCFLHQDRLLRVGVDDVQRVARAYLRAANRTAGLLLSVSEPDRVHISRTVDAGDELQDYAEADAAAAVSQDMSLENIEDHVTRVTLPSGVKTAFLERPTRGQTVHAEFHLRYGSEETLDGHRCALQLLPVVMHRGTKAMNFGDLQDAIDLLQSKITVGGRPGMLTATIDTDREHVVPAIELLAEILRQPAFSPAQFEQVRDEKIVGIENNRTDPVQSALNALRRELYPQPDGSIHHTPTFEEQISEYRSVELATVESLYRRLVGAEHLLVGVVGDFDRAAVLRTIEEAFGSWRSPSHYRRIPRPYRSVRSAERRISIPDSRMAVVFDATAIELRDDDPDFAALNLAAYVFCQGSSTRIETRLRHEEGLCYHVSGELSADSRDRNAYLYTLAICAPDDAGRTRELLREETRRWIDEGISDEELRAGRESLMSDQEVRYADDEHVAAELVRGLAANRSLAFHHELMQRTSRLTANAVNRALRERLGGARFITVTAGAADGVGD